MKGMRGAAILLAAGLMFIFAGFGGCTSLRGGVSVDREPEPRGQGGGPPAHAPAHGYRAKHLYRYYPSAEVYFDVSRKVYFYLEAGAWRMSAGLPEALRVSLGDYVTIETDTDRPYTEHWDHKKKYPPGQMKGKKPKKW